MAARSRAAVNASKERSARRARRRVLAALAVFATVVSLQMADRDPVEAQTTPARATGAAATLPWDQQVIYVLIPDKYADDPSDPPTTTSRLDGDLVGAVARVGHIKSMTGLTTVLIYPIFEQRDTPRYYNTTDYSRIESDFMGSSAATDASDPSNPYRQLVERLHEPALGSTGGMRVLQDLPISSVGYEHLWRVSGDYAKFRLWVSFPPGTANPNVADSPAFVGGPTHPVDNNLGGFILDHAARRDEIERTLVYPFADRYGIDGYRYDSVHLTAASFWPDFIQDMNARYSPNPSVYRFDSMSELLPWYLDRPFAQSQASYGVPGSSSPSQPQVSGGYDTSQITAIQDVFARGASARGLEHPTTSDTRRLTAAIDNYEACSFRSQVTDGNKDLRTLAALTYLLTNDRVPMIYSGNEYAIDYGPHFDASFGCPAHDPDVLGAGALFDGAVQTDRADEFAQVRALIALRTQPAISRGDMRWMSQGYNFIAYARTLAGADTFIVTHSLASGADRRVTHSLEQNVVCGPGATSLPVSSARDIGVSIGSGVGSSAITNHGLVTRTTRPAGVRSTVTRCSPATEPFADVDSSTPSYDAITWASAWGIVSGATPTQFAAADPMLRGDAILSLFRLRAPSSPPACDPSIYNDVGTGSPYCVATTWAVQKGILTGTTGGHGTFAGDQPLIRQEAAKWLHRFAGEPAAEGTACTPALPRTGAPTTVPCYDTYGITNGAADAIRWIGYTPATPGTPVATGNASGSFEPSAPITRATYASWLYAFDRQPSRTGGPGN